MKILVILAHQNRESYNHAISHTVCQALGEAGHNVTLHDLCAEGFDPLLPKEEIPENGVVPPNIQKYCQELQSTDGIVIIHPNWWCQAPAILKGWLDRVIRPGIAYKFEGKEGEEGQIVGLLKGKRTLVINTCDTPDQIQRSVYNDPLANLWKHGILGFCGIEDVEYKVFNMVTLSSPEQRKAWLKEVRQSALRIFSA